jgi:mono/diheme cytochrome c family protein
MTSVRLLFAAPLAALLAAPLAGAASGPQVWSGAGCGGCHTLAAAGSSGTDGPNLDELRPSAAAVAAQVEHGGGGMPAFGASLSKAEINAVAAYVSSASGASPGRQPSTSHVGLSTRAVRALQRNLKQLHFFSGPVTGRYGKLTTAAVKHFQAANGLSVDGVWGPRSDAMLTRLLRHS